MADPDVIQMPRPLPDVIVISGSGDLRLTANEMRRLKEASGRTMTELMGEGADEADRLQAMVWLRLRRDGHDPTWEQAGDVALETEEEPPDPTSGERSTSSPSSVGSGG
jgi:hypothetical protein